MMISWISYALLVSALLAFAALAAERALRLVAGPARLVWIGAMALSVLIPAVGYATTAWLPESVLGLPSVGLSERLLPVTWGATLGPASASSALEIGIGIAWLAASLVLAGGFVLSQWRLARRRSGWRQADVDAVPVLISRGTGPATVGGLRPRVVLPEWALDLPRATREMILRHELEHVRARDGMVAIIGFAIAALTPWNAAIWWMLARLRLAQEIDCDRRLLFGGTPVREYVDLLMTAGQSGFRQRLGAPGLSFPRSSLRRRILVMTHTPRRASLAHAAAVGVAAAGLGLLACDTPAPGETGLLTGPSAQAVPRMDEALDFTVREIMHVEWSEEPTVLGPEVAKRLDLLLRAAMEDESRAKRRWRFAVTEFELTPVDASYRVQQELEKRARLATDGERPRLDRSEWRNR